MHSYMVFTAQQAAMAAGSRQIAAMAAVSNQVLLMNTAGCC
jgi:hypothetical protein